MAANDASVRNDDALPGGAARPRRWLFALGTAAGLAALALIKFWPLVRPWDRQHFTMDLSLGIEGYFYALLKRGVPFLWDPTVVTGNLTIGGGLHHPQYAQALFHLFYPPSLLVFGLAEHRAYVPHLVLVWYQIAHYVLAGGFTVLYVRSLGVSRVGAFLSGATFMLSAFLVSHVQHWLMVATVAWLPLALYCLRRAMAGPSLAWAAFTGIPLAMSFMGGHPQAFVYVLTAVGLALVVALVDAAAKAGRVRPALRAISSRLAAFGVAGVFACVLGALLLLPVLDLQIWKRQPSEVYPFEWKAQGSLPPYLLAKLVLPNVPDLLGDVDASETGLYLGVLPLVLALLGALTVRARPVYFHAALGILAVVLAFGGHTPLFRLVYDLVPGYGANRVPARILVLLAFAAAVLAGYGADVLGGSPGPAGLRAVTRAVGTLRWVLGAVALLATGALSATFFMLDDSTRAHQALYLVTDLTILALLLAATLGVLSVAAHSGSRRVVGGLAVTLAVVDLLFWGFTIERADPRSPDERLTQNADVVAFLQRDASPFRLGMSGTMTIPTYQLYQNGWAVYNDEDRLLPPNVQDLFFLTDKNPRIVDLLNVKYVLGGKHRTALTKYSSLDVSADVPEKALPVDTPGTVSAVTLVSAMGDARQVPNGMPVATITLEGEGRATSLTVRAGIESAEWAWDHPFEPRPAHGRGAVARSWTVPGHGFTAHEYQASWRLSRPLQPTRVRLRYLLARGSLTVRSLRLGGTDLAALASRFRPVHRLVEENRYALPRAFFVPAIRVVPDRAGRLALMERFDPEAEALVNRLPPGIDPALLTTSVPLEPGERAAVVASRFDRIEIQAAAARPRLLVVSDTWSRWWRATDNGRPVPILVADHALRGVVLGPGTHHLVFEFGYPIFWIAAGITLGGWLGIVAIAVTRHRVRAFAAVPHEAVAPRPVEGGHGS